MSAVVISGEAVTLSGGSATITIPSDCTRVVVTWTYYNSTDASGLTSATLNSASPDESSELPTSGAETATGVLSWNNPATGARTLAMTFDAATSEGPTIIATYIKQGTSTWRSVGHNAATAATANSVTLDPTVSGDLVVKHDQSFAENPPALSASWTSVATQSNVAGESARVSYILASGATTVCDSEDENYSTVVAFALADGGAPPVGGIWGIRNHHRALLVR